MSEHPYPSIVAYGITAFIKPGYYGNGRLAVFLEEEDGTPFATFSVNLPDESLEPLEFFAKTWSENEALREPMLSCGLFVDTGRRVATGFVEAEVWRLHPTFQPDPET